MGLGTPWKGLRSSHNSKSLQRLFLLPPIYVPLFYTRQISTWTFKTEVMMTYLPVMFLLCPKGLSFLCLCSPRMLHLLLVKVICQAIRKVTFHMSCFSSGLYTGVRSLCTGINSTIFESVLQALL